MSSSNLQILPLSTAGPTHTRLDIIRTEGDSLMTGAVQATLAVLVGGYTLTNTAVGGSEMEDILSRVSDPGNAHLLPQTTVFWDGSHNGLTTVAAYCDLLATAIARLGHDRFVVIPPINPFGSTWAGSTSEQVATEMLSRWPDNFLHWEDWLDNSGNSIVQSEFQDAPSDPWHVSQAGADHIGIGIAQTLQAKGWLPSTGSDLILASGSAWLFDPSNIGGGFASVPSNTQIIPNPAWASAATMIGSGDATSLGTYVAIKDTNSGADLFAERTAKGGLHVVLSQGSSYVGSNVQGFFLQPNALIQQYLDAHVDDDWYFSFWGTYTRAPTTAIAPQSPLYKAQNTANYLLHMGGDKAPNPASGPNSLGVLAQPSVTGYVEGEPQIRAVGTNGYTGVQPALGASGTGLGVGGQFGLYLTLGAGGAWAGFNSGKAPSMIAYRVYAENLTVSGRTFAQVAAIDEILWRDAFSSSGRFGDDSWSDPDVVLG